MALSPGTRLGPYEVISALGAGGMGEVYRARDTKLGREVALKIISDAFAQDGERVARFKREAQVLASLNHPHIAAIYGFEDSGETHALVLELVEGETLDELIGRRAGRHVGRTLSGSPGEPDTGVPAAPARWGGVARPTGLPVDEALPIARQIAEALEAAHEQGIIHRDLKPANIKITPDGIVKVLDFGLAKLNVPNGPNDPNGPNALSMSPTITSPAMMTGAGMILGTAAYMSPEQAKGMEADKRSDIWAFGCVLFEMLTGKRPFDGEDVTDVMVAVLSKDPDWTTLPANLPAPVRTLLRRCLEKDRKRRLDSAAAARLEIDEGPATATPTGPANVHVQVSGWRRAFPWAIALGTGLALLVVLWAPWRKAASPAQMRLTAELGADASLAFTRVGDGLSAAAVLSPDGQTLAFVARKGTGAPQLYVRRLDQLQARILPGSDEASSPFFSPDGQWIAFFAEGKLKKVSVTGGAAVELCDAEGPRGGVWADAATIVFQPKSSSGGNLMRVSSAGGKPEPLTTLAEGEATQRYPQVLPGGKAVLFTSNFSTGAGYENANIVVQPLPSGPRKILQRGGYYGRYLPSGTSIGHLVYVQDGTLFAAPFDLDRLELVGPPVPAIEGVASATTVGSAQFAASDTGTLVYVPGQSAGLGRSIDWMDQTGKAVALRAAAANWSNPRFSPDGRRLALDIGGGTGLDVWVYEWARDTLTRLTFDPSADRNPVWTPDGRRIVFASARGDKTTPNLYWQRADGTGDAQRLTESRNLQYPASWHPNGKLLAFEENTPQTGWNLLMLPMEGDEASGWKPGTPTVFLNSPANEREPMFSPDGRWLAYESNESGRYEVYVRPFPGPGGKWQISTSGGANATWSRARHELFFETPDDQHLMVASYAVDGDSFRADKPRLWSERRFLPAVRNFRGFDLHPDGERFALAAEPQSTAMQNKVVFIFNFFDELRRIAPATSR